MPSSATTTVADALSRFRAGETVETATPEPVAPAAPAVPTARTRRVAFPRPNGEQYYARSLPGGTHDVDALRNSLGATIQDNIYFLFHGKPGTGKTAGVEAAFPATLLTVEGDGDTEVADFVGSWVQLPDGTYEWADGPLVIAAENGWPLFIDEIALIPPTVMAVVYAAMDGRGKFRVKANPRRDIVVVKQGFTVIGACNPDAPGANMSEALMSRFTVHVEATTDYDLAKSIGVPQKLITAAKNLATQASRNEVSWVPQMRELLAFKRNMERYGVDFAVANLIGVAPEDDRAIVADVVSRSFGAAIAPLRQGDAAVTAV
jgi:nitric oxide reductase NorQ protein